MHARTLSRIVVAKAIAALALTAGAGGVAVAATSTPLPMDRPEATTHTAVPAASPESDALPAEDTDTDAVAEPPIDPADANGGNGLIGLCRAWAAGAASNPHVAENPAFTRLRTAAGVGAAGSDANDSVAGFCATVTPDDPTPARPTPTPSAAPKPPAEPSGGTRASAKPTGSPAGTTPAKPDRPDTPATGKPDRTNGKSGSTDEKAGKPDTDHPSGRSDGAGSDAGKAAAGG